MKRLKLVMMTLLIAVITPQARAWNDQKQCACSCAPVLTIPGISMQPGATAIPAAAIPTANQPILTIWEARYRREVLARHCYQDHVSDAGSASVSLIRECISRLPSVETIMLGGYVE